MRELILSLPEHVYTIDGRVLPSASQVLNQWVKVEFEGRFWYVNVVTGQKIKAEVFEAAGDRGTAVHDILRFEVAGPGVNTEKLHKDLHPYRDQILAWKEQYKPEPLICEEPMYHPHHWYAGTLDLFCNIPSLKHPVLLDAKSGARGLVELQTAAYEELIRENNRYTKVIDRYVLDLKPEGFKFEKIGTSGDKQMFFNKLNSYKYERRII